MFDVEQQGLVSFFAACTKSRVRPILSITYVIFLTFMGIKFVNPNSSSTNSFTCEGLAAPCLGRRSSEGDDRSV